MDWDMLGKILGISGGLGGAGMGLYQGFGGGYNDPTKKANQMLGQIPGQTQQYYSPYMQAGQGALSDLQNQNKDLLSGNVLNRLGEGYKESPGYKFKLQQALQAGSGAAAAGGLLGTPAHQQGNMQLANDIASQDYNDYLHNQMGLYGLGYQGEQGINNQGFDANRGMADTIGNVIGQQAGLSYAGEAGKNTYRQGGWNNVVSGLAQAGSAAMGMPPGLIELLSSFSSGHGRGV